MADDSHDKMIEDNPRRLKGIVAALAVIYVMTFLSGFLQDTQFNFVNYIFFSLLCIGGIGLMKVTVKSKASGWTDKAFLLLTGVSSTLLLIFYTGYEWSRLGDYNDLEASMEALCYLTTLFFWIGVIGSLIFTRRPKGIKSSQPTVDG